MYSIYVQLLQQNSDYANPTSSSGNGFESWPKQLDVEIGPLHSLNFMLKLVKSMG